MPKVFLFNTTPENSWQMIKYYSINGELVLKEKAAIGITDLSILRGYGIFDYFVVKQGYPLFFDDYLDRFENSSKAFQLSLPFNREELKRQVYTLIKANGVSEAGVKIVLTGGYSENGYTPSVPNLLLLIAPAPTYPNTHYDKGIKLMLHEYHRTFPTTKSINYIVGINLLPQMKAAGAEDVLFHFGGQVHETTRANFFIVNKDDTIVTSGENILKGVTRKKTLEIARKHYRVEERNLAFNELETAKEAFITSSTKQVMPVVQLSDLIIGDGKVGAISKHLLKLFREMETEYLSAFTI